MSRRYKPPVEVRDRRARRRLPVELELGEVVGEMFPSYTHGERCLRDAEVVYTLTL